MTASRDKIALALILVSAALCRANELGRRPLWLDEQFSVSQALGATRKDPVPTGPTFTPADVWKPTSFEQIVSASARQDSANGILHSVVLRAWMGLVGFSDSRVRIPSLVADLVTILLVFGFCRALFGGRVALVAALICAVNPLLYNLSREARSYAFATATTLGASWLFFRLLFRPTNPRRWWLWIAYALLAAASLLLHYLTVGILAAHALLAAAFARDRKQWMGVGLAAVLIVAIFSAWMGLWGYHGADSVGAQERSYKQRLEQPDPHEEYVLPATARNLAAGAAQVLLPLTGNFLQMGGLHLARLAPLMAVPFALMALAWFGRPRTEERRLLVALFALFLAAPLVALAASLRTGHIVPFQPRYCVFSLPYAMILVAVGIAAAARASRRWVTLPLVGLFLGIELASLLAVRQRSFDPQQEPHERLAADLLAHYHPGDVVTFQSWKTARMVNLYLPRRAPIVQRVHPAANEDDLTMTIQSPR